MPEKDPYEPIRVKAADTGYHLTLLRIQTLGGGYTELKQDAVDASGAWLEPDYNPGETAAKSKDA